MKRALRAFGAFWWDFLIGDAPEFAVVTLATVGLAYLLRQHHMVAAFVLPLFITAALFASVYHGRQRAGSDTRSGPSFEAVEAVEVVDGAGEGSAG